MVLLYLVANLRLNLTPWCVATLYQKLVPKLLIYVHVGTQLIRTSSNHHPLYDVLFEALTLSVSIYICFSFLSPILTVRSLPLVFVNSLFVVFITANYPNYYLILCMVLSPKFQLVFPFLSLVSIKFTNNIPLSAFILSSSAFITTECHVIIEALSLYHHHVS